MDGVTLTDTRILLETGSAVVTVKHPSKLDRVEVDVGDAVVVVRGDGVYRFDADRFDASTPWLRVFSGRAEASRKEESHPDEGGPNRVVKRGQAVKFRDLLVSTFDRKETDELQQWAEIRGTSPVVMMTPIICYSNPTNMAEFQDYMRNCMHIPLEPK